MAPPVLRGLAADSVLCARWGAPLGPEDLSLCPWAGLGSGTAAFCPGHPPLSEREGLGWETRLLGGCPPHRLCTPKVRSHQPTGMEEGALGHVFP